MTDAPPPPRDDPTAGSNYGHTIRASGSGSVYANRGDVRINEPPDPRPTLKAARIGALAVLAAAVIAGAATLLAPMLSKDSSAGKETAELHLSADSVAIGGQYTAEASGFESKEPVRLSWNDRPDREGAQVIQDLTADDDGRVSVVIHEGASPGMYVIFAAGLRSGRTASASLRVVEAAPPKLVASAKANRRGSTDGITVTVEQVDRYDNGLVVLHLAAAHNKTSTVSLAGHEFRAADPTGRSYGADGQQSQWDGQISARQTVRGTIALDGPVDQAVRSLQVTFQQVFTDHGFRDLSITDVPVPAA
ncbi:hypothetical protein AB0K00_48570 [Dactylosporangium sp. NPDC049525]|uniref:hypothetical protein n=1 Tax=Dactylosporangium sp. NPDC049525 TaxID=3154730 RepID=UPI003438E76E